MYYASEVDALSVSLTQSINLFYFALGNKFSNLSILENFIRKQKHFNAFPKTPN